MPNPPAHDKNISSLKPQLPRAVYVVGVVSFFNDIATEMVTPLIPILLASTLGAGPVILGLVEGLANAVAAFVRLWSGRLSDVSGGRRKPLAVTGYLLSNLARPLFAVATSWWHVVVIRAVDRVGKGIRSAPRDALLVDLAPAHLRARAFGVHSAFDNLGAVGGALLGALVIMAFSFGLKEMLWLSAIPGLLAVALLAFGVKEPPKSTPDEKLTMRFRWSDVPPKLRGYLLVTTLFTFARTAELFVILRATELGASTAHALLLWAAFNFVKIFANVGAGVLSDQFGRIRLLVPGWLLYSVSMFGLCFVTSITTLWIAVLFFGFAMSIGEGVERAVLGDHALEAERGTLFGWYYALFGLASIPAGLLLGWIWQKHGPHFAYAFAGGIGFVSSSILFFVVAPKLRANNIH